MNISSFLPVFGLIIGILVTLPMRTLLWDAVREGKASSGKKPTGPVFAALYVVLVAVVGTNALLFCGVGMLYMRTYQALGATPIFWGSLGSAVLLLVLLFRPVAPKEVRESRRAGGGVVGRIVRGYCIEAVILVGPLLWAVILLR